ncbi:MAG: ROK family protein [Lentisphaeria bacterium]|nr:ROK family protein [Lentisphaeria bacterium]
MEYGHLNVLPFGNRSLMQVLAAVWRTPGISRFRIASLMEQASVSAIKQVNRLIEERILEEGESCTSTKRGRREIPLFFRRDLFFTVGVAFNRQEAKAVVCDASSAVLEEKLFPSLPPAFPERADAVADGVRELLGKLGIDRGATVGVGVTVPGIMNTRTGEVLSTPEFSRDRHFNLVERFEKRLSLPVRLLNVPHTLVFLEQYAGKGRGLADFLYFDLPGYGLGMVLGGRPYSGSRGWAGECGMLQMYEHGPAGMDGRIGTLSKVSPFYELTDRLTGVLRENSSPLVAAELAKSGGSKVTLPVVARAIRAGDRLCAQLMAEQFDAVARAVVNLAYLLNPEGIFLPPWTAECPEVSLEIVRRQMGHYEACYGAAPRIEPAAYGKEELALAASLIPVRCCFEKYLKNGR